jgi:hypothetical protein
MEGKDEKIYQMFDAMIRFFFKEDPDRLDDEAYAVRISELKWLAKQGFLRGITL